jgi:1-pyrroline-4-hydroxy-2-carboxylate deaminase
MKPNWTGVYPAVTTKFFEDETLDLKTFTYNINEQIKAGVHGIIICGSLGENSTLTYEEKLTLRE